MTDTLKTVLGLFLAAIASVAIAYVPNQKFARDAVEAKIKSDEVAAILHDMIDAEVKKTVSERASIPKGTIIAWYRKSGPVPDGWAICDGSNETPNLVEKFIMGAENQGANGQSVGKGRGVLTLPSHFHPLASGQKDKRVLRTMHEPVYSDPNTPAEGVQNAFTETDPSKDLELSQVPASIKILYLMKL